METQREETCGHSGGRRGWDEWREYQENIHFTACRLDGHWEFAALLRELKLVLCDNRGGGRWEGGPRGRGHVYTYG